MSRAFKCARCNEYGDGKGRKIGICEYEGFSGYSFDIEITLCTGCKEDIYQVIEEQIKKDELESTTSNG